MKPTLVILAAGMGRRYGGLKQLEPVGPSGETIMDYSVYDALRAGFGKAVFVIRPDMEVAFLKTLGRRYETYMPVVHVLQRLDALPGGFTVPPGRTKPWGTGHAVLAAEGCVHEPFAVVNADDFYGAGSLATLGTFLQQEHGGDVPTYAMVGFTLRDTLTAAGSVSRGCCRRDTDGWLESITEVTGIEPHGLDARCPGESGEMEILSGDHIVSMNAWGFQPAFFDQLRACFEGFLGQEDRPGAEFYIPAAVQELIRIGRARVRILRTTDTWCGVTHPEDGPRVVEMIGKLVDTGEYPRKLWD